MKRKFILLNINFWLHPERFSPNMDGTNFWHGFKFYAIKAGWMPLVLLLWVSAQAVNAYFNLPIYYPEIYLSSMSENWSIDVLQNFKVCLKSTLFPFILYLLLLAPVVTIIPLLINRNIIYYGTIYWAYAFSAIVISMFNIQSIGISLCVVNILTFLFISRSMHFGEFDGINENQKSDGIDENQVKGLYRLPFLVIWLTYGIIAYFSDKINTTFLTWLSLGIVVVILNNLLSKSTYLIKISGSILSAKESRKALLLCILTYLVIVSLQLSFLCCFYFWGVLSINSILLGLGFSLLIWTIAYLRIFAWLLALIRINFLNDGGFISTISPLPLWIKTNCLYRLVASKPLEYLAYGNYLLESKGWHQHFGRKLIDIALRNLKVEDNLYLHGKIEYLKNKNSKGH